MLSVRLNPHVNIYLDKNGTVLAIEPLNEDAELIMGELSNITDYQTVVQVFISESYSKGYVKLTVGYYNFDENGGVGDASDDMIEYEYQDIIDSIDIIINLL